MTPLGKSSLVRFAVLASLSVSFVASLSAQTLQIPRRITAQIDENQRTTLAHTVHPLANKANDRGLAPDSTQLDRIQVVLKHSDAQDAALRQFLTDVHTPGSASYHK